MSASAASAAPADVCAWQSTPPLPRQRTQKNTSASNVSERVNFIQLNLQHNKTATAVLRQQVETLDNAVVLIQEPWINNNRILGLNVKNGTTYRGTINEPSRSCIVVKGLQAYNLPQLGNRDITVVCITYSYEGRTSDVLVASVYMPIDKGLPLTELDHIIQYSDNYGIPLIIASDTNAHHFMWGCSEYNQRGQALSEFLATTELDIANEGCEYTFCSGNKRSIIDVTLVTRSLHQYIHDWHVDWQDTLSDHRQICFFLRRDKPIAKRIRNRRNTNWATYNQELEQKIGMWFGKVENPKDIENELTKVSSVLIQSFEKACPERRIGRRNRVPWWNKDLTILRKKANKAFHKAYETKDQKDWEKHKEARRAFKKLLRRSKRESWHNFCTRIESEHESARLYKILGKNTSAQMGMLHLPDGEWTKTPEEAYKHLLSVHFPDCSIDEIGRQNDTYCGLRKWIPSVNWTVASEIVTVDRIEWAFSTMSPYKSPGEDGIFPALLQKGGKYILNPICNIYRASLACCYIPLAWRNARVTFIPKPGKMDYTVAKSFRPISLTSFLLKGLEKLVDRYLRDGPMATLPMHPRQHAYQAGKSTESALHQLVGRIEKALDAKEFALGIFFDIEGAFDNTPCEAVRKALTEWDIHVSVQNWITTLIKRRKVCVRNDHTDITATTNGGLPQGGGLSPTLWSAVANSLLKWLSKQGVFVQGYADDGVILIIGRILGTLCDIAQRTLKGVEKWCRERRLSVNPGKTEMVLFTKRYKIEGMKPIIFYNQELACSKQVKYLGVILDSKLNWKAHVDAKCQKAIVAFAQLRRTTGKTWGHSPKIAYWLYTMVIRPMLCYAAVIWWPRVTYITVEKQLEHVQRLSCLLITGAMRTTPTAALELIIGLTPITVYIKQEAMLACFRLQTNSQWVSNACGHTSIKSNLHNNIPIPHWRCDKIIPRYMFDKNYVVEIPVRLDWTNNNVNLCDDIVCYTDGSRLESHSSSGASVFEQTQNKKHILPLGRYATVFQAEVYAILTCTDLLCNSVDRSITICSDSQAALKSISSAKTTSGLVWETMTKLQDLSMNNCVRLLWVPGHSKIEGNEIADALARQAASSDFIGPEPALGLSAMSTKRIIRKWSVCEQNKRWHNLQGCRQAKQLMLGVNTRLSKYALRLPRRDVRILVGLLTGHNTLNRHLALLKKQSDATCPLCEDEQETSLHFLGRCSATMVRRIQYFERPFLNPCELRQEHWATLLRFAKTSKRF